MWPDLYRCLCPGLYLCLIAYGCSLVFGIAPTHFALTAPELNVRTALLVILLGVACAAVSRLLCYTLHFMGCTNPWPKLLPGPRGVAVFAGRRAGSRLFLSVRRGAV